MSGLRTREEEVSSSGMVLTTGYAAAGRLPAFIASTAASGLGSGSPAWA
jgi:hypothetical protein